MRSQERSFPLYLIRFKIHKYSLKSRKTFIMPICLMRKLKTIMSFSQDSSSQSTVLPFLSSLNMENSAVTESRISDSFADVSHAYRWCQPHNRCLINICGMNEHMGGASFPQYMKEIWGISYLFKTWFSELYNEIKHTYRKAPVLSVQVSDFLHEHIHGASSQTHRHCAPSSLRRVKLPSLPNCGFVLPVFELSVD